MGSGKRCENGQPLESAALEVPRGPEDKEMSFWGQCCGAKGHLEAVWISPWFSSFKDLLARKERH